MKKPDFKLKRGFIGYIILIIIAIVLLKFWLQIDVIDWLNKPDVKEFFLKLWSVITLIWEKYIAVFVKKILDVINYLISRYL